jgi:5-methyltetrahydrofolate--homocysteine methyltransferase
MNNEVASIYQGILEGNMESVQANVQAALKADVPAAEILQQGLIAAMDEVGKLFENGEFFVPEMLIAARAMKAGLEILRPLLIDSGVEPVGKVIIGTVKGDLHDIGKNLVGMLLEGAGFEIIDLGVDVAPEAFVAAAREGASLIGMSALLTTTMNNMGVTIEALKTAGLRDKVKVLVGGAPVTQEYADSIGADAFASDASSAARIARQLVVLRGNQTQIQI